jgi:hypothetical protein
MDQILAVIEAALISPQLSGAVLGRNMLLPIKRIAFEHVCA